MEFDLSEQETLADPEPAPALTAQGIRELIEGSVRAVEAMTDKQVIAAANSGLLDRRFLVERGMNVSGQKRKSIRASCPVCHWHSSWTEVPTTPNAMWFTKRDVNITYHDHYMKEHLALPRAGWEEMESGE
jgi:hypothetical protein